MKGGATFVVVDLKGSGLEYRATGGAAPEGGHLVEPEQIAGIAATRGQRGKSSGVVVLRSEIVGRRTNIVVIAYRQPALGGGQ